MNNVKSKVVLSSVKSYCVRNKRALLCALIAYTVGIVIGIVSAIRATDGQFERVARIDMQLGSAKVFFISALAFAGCYLLIVVAGFKSKTAFMGVVPFVAVGFFMGEYATALIARYEIMGVLNVLFVYTPLFCASASCMAIALARALSTPCGIVGCSYQQKQPIFVSILKIFGINMGINFVFVMIIGSMFGVIIVSLY